METRFNKNDLIHHLIVRRAEQEKKRVIMERGYDHYCCGMCKRKSKSMLTLGERKSTAWPIAESLSDQTPGVSNYEGQPNDFTFKVDRATNTESDPYLISKSSLSEKFRRTSRKRVAPLDQIDSMRFDLGLDASPAAKSSLAFVQDGAEAASKERRTTSYLDQRSEFLDAYERYLDSIINRKDVTKHLDTYDPYEHRHHKKLSTWGAINHVIRSMLGVGMLKMPKVYKENGLYNGVAVTIAFITAAAFTMHVMIVTRNKICIKLKIPWLSIGNTVKEAFNMGPSRLRRFATAAKYTVEMCVVIKQLILNMILVRFLTFLIARIYWKTYETQIPPESILSIFIIVPFLYVTLVRNLRKLVFHSALGNLLVIIVTAIITFHTSSKLEDVNLRRKTINFSSLTDFLTVGMLALDSMELGLAVESRMQNPKSFLGIVGVYNVGLVFSTVVVLLTGVFGYWKYGENVEDFLLENLPFGHKMLTAFAVTYTVMLSSTFALHLYLPSKILWRSFVSKTVKDSKHRSLWRLLTKQSLVLIVFTSSYLPPIVHKVTIAVGVTLMPLISITLPVFLHLLALREISKKIKVYYMIRDITFIILSMGITGCCLVQMTLSK